MQMTRPWSPLLQGQTAARAWEVILALAAALAEEQEAITTASYCHGHAGIALFYSYLAVATGDDEQEKHAVAAMDRAIAACSSAESSRLGLFGGASGVAWACRHIHDLLWSEEDAELTVEIDSALLQAVRRSPWPWEYDLFYGVTGLGLYALDHPDRTFAGSVVNEVVSRLAELAVPGEPGLTWLSRPEFMPPDYQERYPDGRLDLCVAHGVSGVIGFLARCCQLDCERERARQLLRGAVDWLLAHKRGADEGSTFSAFLDTRFQSCRSAWCYGDPGVSGALLSAAQALAEPSWEQEAISIALNDCRRPVESCQVFDAQVCHGAAGLGHLYNRMYQATGNQEFAAAAETWFKKTLGLRAPGHGLAGYLSWWAGSQEWKTDPGLLSGIAGIGLTLLGAVAAIEPRWDHPFLLPQG